MATSNVIEVRWKAEGTEDGRRFGPVWYRRADGVIEGALKSRQPEAEARALAKTLNVPFKEV